MSAFNNGENDEIQNQIQMIQNQIQMIHNNFSCNELLEIVEVENDSHDCVIDIPDSQNSNEEEIICPLIDLEQGLEGIKMPTINVHTATRLLGKGQDAVYSGKFQDCNGLKGDYIATYDGHGSHSCIKAIRSFNQDEIMGDVEPVNCVIDKLRNYRKTHGINMIDSGSTFVYAKIFTENEDGLGLGYINIGNVSDSELVVFINGELVFRTKPQIAQNEGEIERLKRENRVCFVKPLSDDLKPLVHADDKITNERAYTINYNCMKPIVSTSSLGHNDLTGYAPEHKILTFDLDSDRVKIVCASDGLWDMVNTDIEGDKDCLLTMDAESLCSFAERRWKQEWKYCHDKNNMFNFKVTKFPSYDDIGVVTYEYIGPHA